MNALMCKCVSVLVRMWECFFNVLIRECGDAFMNAFAPQGDSLQ